MNTQYSYSRLKKFADCPRQYKFQYIEKPDVPRRETPDTYLGRAVHRVLQALYKTGADGVVIPLEDMLGEYRQYWSHVNTERMVVTSEHYTVDDYIRIGENILRRHYDKYRPFDQGQLLGTELRLRFALPGTSMKFLAIVDKLWRREDGVVEITDYKTGQTLPRPSDAGFVRQMGLYQLAVTANYPQFSNIELAQFYLRQDEVVRCRLRQDQLDELIEALRTLVMEIENAIRLDSFPPVEGWPCNYCDYLPLCPAKRHARLLEDGAEDEHTEAERLQQLADIYLKRNDELRALKAEVEALKEDIKTAATDRDMAVLTGRKGQVNIRLSRIEKFITKSRDAAAFAELNRLVRDFGLDEYLSVDSAALMKEIYAKRRLSEDQLAALGRYVEETTSSRITGKWFDEAEEE